MPTSNAHDAGMHEPSVGNDSPNFSLVYTHLAQSMAVSVQAEQVAFRIDDGSNSAMVTVALASKLGPLPTTKVPTSSWVSVCDSLASSVAGFHRTYLQELLPPGDSAGYEIRDVLFYDPLTESWESILVLFESAKSIPPHFAAVADSFARSLSELRRAEERCSSEAACLRALDSATVIALTDTKGVILKANVGFCRLSGYSQDELVGNKHTIINSGVHSQAFFREMYRTIGRGKIWQGEVCNRAKDGSLYWVDTRIVPIRNPSGKVHRYLALRIDITKRKTVEEREKRSERLLQTALDAIPQRVFWKDRQGSYLGANAAFLKDSGLEQVHGLNDFDMPWNVHEGESYRADDKVIMAQRVARLNIVETQIGSDGKQRWIRTNKIPLLSHDGEVVGVLGTYEDITEYKENEAALARSRDEARTADRVKSEFLANMSHEIRTPMNGVLGMNELLLETSLTTEQHELAQTVHESALSLLRVIDDILDFSKVEAGKVDLECVPFSIRELLESVERINTPRARQKEITLAIQVDPELPERLLGDPGRVRQVLLNLLGNAMKFTPTNGSVAIAVQQLQEIGEQVTFRTIVIDNGIGIPSDKQRLVFEAFRQVDSSTTRKHGGSGLGLAISSQLVQLMGGTIDVRSQIGVGTAFYFDLTLTKAPNAKDCPPPECEPLVTRPLRILLAEDNVVNQRLASLILEKQGHQVTVVNNGQEAVQLVSDREYDLVLMDIQMPVLGGEEAVRQIRKLAHGQNVPIVALTAHAMSSDRERYIAAGMDLYLAKPFKREELLKIVSSVAN